MSLLALRNEKVMTDENAGPRESAHWSRSLIAIAITFVVIATIAYLLRIYSRQKKTVWRVALEDVLMGIGLIFSYLLSACVIIGTSLTLASI